MVELFKVGHKDRLESQIQTRIMKNNRENKHSVKRDIGQTATTSIQSQHRTKPDLK